MISALTYLIASAVEWYDQNRMTRKTLSHAWDPRATEMVAIRETSSGAIGVPASDKEGAAPLPTMT